MNRFLVAVAVLAMFLPVAPSAAAPNVVASAMGNRTALPCDTQLVLRGDPEPVAPGTCPGVRPGAYVESEDLSGERAGCSFNFVFNGFTRGVDPVALGRYIGTAGHCVLVTEGQHSWSAGKGPRVFDSTGRHINRYVFAVQKGARDFALIKLLPGVRSNPRMCHWGGPTGIIAGPVEGTLELKHFGQGTGLGDTIPARTAIGQDLADRDEARAWGAVVFGDSGSGIIAADGRALGVIVSMGAGYTPGGSGTVGITRLSPQVDLAEQVLGLDFRLVTAPRLP